MKVFTNIPSSTKRILFRLFLEKYAVEPVKITEHVYYENKKFIVVEEYHFQ